MTTTSRPNTKPPQIDPIVPYDPNVSARPHCRQPSDSRKNSQLGYGSGLRGVAFYVLSLARACASLVTNMCVVVDCGFFLMCCESVYSHQCGSSYLEDSPGGVVVSRPDQHQDGSSPAAFATGHHVIPDFALR
ncbi:hypothetical protein AOL_s00188g323 [Orbilia oligospora ATCC 24927]|uniref:Uncharacterized protein n=1 Tax=Arthrobotrys oligospora (strain ATCC 24927 / CBS 115.81 / DSM 1491) TaxID=756982 RepID=G1XQW1_ARTOA|nr:hypothetical protein AOL_s00188g323 [Orbilia oligospora ATCC 24927]EGX44655.1 hypothetical protein AOL_s00188g323 [Orbilia oligospora ATCC 24927]